ncbi:MAG TPA: SIMPL domain-containing protein [Balneolales bacterium]|nr:SIMPL domain-containing protein [Balneolales bacterium]
MEKKQLIAASSIFSAAVIIGVIILSVTWHDNYKMNQTISVTGSAKEIITSDLGYLRGTIKSTGQTAIEAYENLQRQKPVLLNYLKEQGFPKDSVRFFTVNSYNREQLDEKGRPTGKILAYYYNQRIEIKSKNVELIRKISIDISSLIKKGVDFDVEPPQYFYTNLAGLKIDIQAEAAKDAMQRAQRIAKSTGRILGPLTGARMGVLQITPVNSTQVSNYGIHNVTTIKKEITGVVSATFMIE